MSLHQDPNWPRASAWLKGEQLESTIGRLGVIGAPLRLGSISPGRCDLAPAAMRATLERFCSYDLEWDHDLRKLAVTDAGDLGIAEMRIEDAFAPIVDGVAACLGDSDAVVALGGDNAITRPGVHSVCRVLGGDLSKVGLITLDAHFDLRDTNQGLTNGNPVRALLDDGMPGENIVQVGIQSFVNSDAYAQVAKNAGISVVTMDQVHNLGIDAAFSDQLAYLDKRVEAIYFDLDLDTMDRSFAPATPGSRPGGIAPWQATRAARLCGAHPKVKVMDLVEMDPEQDIADATSLAAGMCLLAFASGVMRRLG